MKKSVQQFMLGSVIKNEKTAKDVLLAIKESGYDEIELCGFMIHKTSMIVRLLTSLAGMPTGNAGSLNWHRLLSEAGLGVTSLHLDLGTLESDTQLCIDEAKGFFTSFIVVTGMYRFDYSSSENVKKLAERLTKVGKILKNQGVSLLYHNHSVELLFTDNGKRAYEILIEETDAEYVNFEFDSYWFAEGGADAAYWMRRLGERMRLWHIADRGSRFTGAAMTPILKSDSVELGRGNMPLCQLIEIAKDCGCEAAVLESHRNWVDKSPVKSLAESAEFLSKHI